MTTIIVTPAANSDGSRAYSGRGALFDGMVEGRLVVTRSPQPLVDGARALLGEGVNPATRIAMRHAGAEIDALRSTIGAAARLTVKDNRGGKPVFGPHQPYPSGALGEAARASNGGGRYPGGGRRGGAPGAIAATRRSAEGRADGTV